MASRNTGGKMILVPGHTWSALKDIQNALREIRSRRPNLGDLIAEAVRENWPEAFDEEEAA